MQNKYTKSVRNYYSHAEKQQLYQAKETAIKRMPFLFKTLFVMLFPEYDTKYGRELYDGVLHRGRLNKDIIKKLVWLSEQIELMQDKNHQAYTIKVPKTIAA